MSIINWEVIKPALWTGAGGVVVGMFLLSYGFGFMSRTTAEKLASTNSERAVVAVLAPVWADKFRALPDVGARTATLVADKDDFYKTAAHRQPVAAAKYFISSGIRARGGRLPISLMDGLGASRAGPLQRQMRALTEPDLRSTVC
jgi:hypothetical protein